MSDPDQSTSPSTHALSEPGQDNPKGDVGHTSSLPLLLGYSGLLPMAAILLGQWLWPLYSDQLLYLATLYVGAIFAFLGGIQWGLTLQLTAASGGREAQRLLVSVLPALVTVVALVIPQAFGCLLLGLGLWALLAFEWLNRGSLRHPTWYLPLRINLTVLLSGSLAAALSLA